MKFGSWVINGMLQVRCIDEKEGEVCCRPRLSD